MIVKDITNWFDKVKSYLVIDTEFQNDNNSEIVKAKGKGYKCSCKVGNCKHIEAVIDYLKERVLCK